MATLYVENVPRELYEALRSRAKQRRRSIAAEVVSLLEENVPSPREIQARRALARKFQHMRARKTRSSRFFPSSEQMQREDRER